MARAKHNITSDDSGTTSSASDGVADCPPAASRFRTILPQILASTAKNLLLIDIGLAIAFPTIVIPVLRGLQSDRNPGETLHFTAEQASWYGSLGFIGQPIGSALSGWVTEPLGRKRAMILVNIPHIIAWTMLYMAQSHEEIYVAVVLIGLGVGLMEAPILTYVGEICQPSIRGILLACSVVAAMVGFLIVYLLGTVTTWRNASLVCLSLPLVTMVAICFIPETPYWLLSKNRTEEARRSLQWLRGWVPAAAVASEFAELQRCSAMSHACDACRKADLVCTHPPAGWRATWHQLFRRGTVRPFVLIMVAFLLTQFSGLSAVRPFMVQIFQTFAVPLDANWATVMVALVNISGNVVCMCTLKAVGKRKLYLFSLVGCLVSCFGIAVLAYVIFPPGYSTFESHLSHPLRPCAANTLVMYMFFSLAFFTNLGMYPVTFTLLSEIFPFRTRGIATGLAVAISYLFSFTSVKTFLDLERLLSIPGVFALYGSVSVVGFVFMFFAMPETEDRTLEEVEMYFSDRNRSMFDRYVPRMGEVASTNRRAADSAKGVDNIASFCDRS